MNIEADLKDWVDAKGRKVPANLVTQTDKLKEQTIDKVVDHAIVLSKQIGRFKGHTFDDVYTLVDLLKEEYGAQLGGAKGNIDLVSFDGCRKLQISVADHISFGPELGVAKGLIDEYIEDVIEGSSDEVRALVIHVLWRKLSDAGVLDKPGRPGLNAFVRSQFEAKWGSVPIDIDTLRDADKINAVVLALKAWCKRAGVSLGR